MTETLRIVSFREPVAGEESSPEPERLIAGQPRLTVHNHYSDPSQQFFGGIWQATRGVWRVRYSEHELCHLLRGRVAITGENGERWEFTAGDTFVVPAGFAGTWDVIEDCQKVYAIFEARK